jgi:hypothetical protein
MDFELVLIREKVNMLPVGYEFICTPFIYRYALCTPVGSSKETKEGRN